MIAISSHLHTFENVCVGTRIENKEKFLAALEKAIEAHDTSRDGANGHHFIIMPTDLAESCGILCGDGRRTLLV